MLSRTYVVKWTVLRSDGTQKQGMWLLPASSPDKARKDAYLHSIYPKEAKFKVVDVIAKEKMTGVPEDTEYKKGKHPRRGWILTRWQWQQRGAVDFGKQAKEEVTPPYPKTSDSQWDAHPSTSKADLVGLDHPRKDIDSFKSKGSQRVYIGATTNQTRRILKQRTQQILRTNFTKKEIDTMGSVYVDGSRPSSRNAAATCLSIKQFKRQGNLDVQTRNHIITVQPKFADKEEPITHELVHARRHGIGEHTYDRDTEEKETELETMARLKEPPKWGGGYYQYIDVRTPHEKLHPSSGMRAFGTKEKRQLEAKLKDRKALTGDVNKNLKGKWTLTKVREYYPRSEIKKAHFSPAERQDRYFKIKAQGKTFDYHMRFEGKPTRNHVIQDLKADFGDNIKVWEWKDGRKVRVI